MFWGKLLLRARTFGVQIYALFLAARDPRTPWHVKLLGIGLAAYLLMPIDLLPDVIPLIGLLDEVILIPLGLKAMASLTPPQVLAVTQAKAAQSPIAHTRLWRWLTIGLALLILLWLLILALLFILLLRWIF